MPHIDDGLLQAWVDRGRSGLSESETAELELHLAGCADCRARAIEAEHFRDRSAGILAGAAPAEIAPPPFEELAARAGLAAAERRSFRRSMVTAAWAASIVAAVGLGWLSRDLLRPQQMAFETARPRTEDLGGAIPPAPPLPTLGTSESIPGPNAAAEVAPATSAAPEAAAVVGRSGAGALPVRSTPERFELSDEPVVVREATVIVPAAPSAATESPLVVRGRVSGERGQPHVGALVMAPGARIGTLTNQDGSYSLSLPAGTRAAGQLTISAHLPGFAPATMAIEARSGDTFAADFRLDPEMPGRESLASAAARGRASNPGADAAPSAAASMASISAFAPPAGSPAPLAITRAEAERRLGRRGILAIPGLTLLRIEVLEDPAGPIAVRVTQVTEAGLEVSLTQQVGDAPKTTSLPPAGHTSVTERRSDLHVTATAALPADSLAAMLRMAR